MKSTSVFLKQFCNSEFFLSVSFSNGQSVWGGCCYKCVFAFWPRFSSYFTVFEPQFQQKMPVPDLQKPAPEFTGTAVVKGQFKDISLSQYKGKYVVLFFYPLDFTFVCPTEIIAFSDRASEFQNINCEVIAASCDSHFSHLAWINTPRKRGGLGEMKIPLLADKSGKIARDYGVLNEDTGVPFRGLFIIDANQNLRQITINDLPVGRSVDETLRLVQAFQYTDEHGEVCPAGWKPGSKTMKPNPDESQEYFKSVSDEVDAM